MRAKRWRQRRAMCGCEDEARCDGAERAEGKGKRTSSRRCVTGSPVVVDERGEVVVVLEEGEAAALLGVLEPGLGGDVVMADACWVFVGCGEAGDEGVVLGGEAELPAAPVDAAVGGDVAGGECRAAGDEVHAEGLLTSSTRVERAKTRSMGAWMGMVSRTMNMLTPVCGSRAA